MTTIADIDRPVVDVDAGVIHVTRPADGGLIADVPIDSADRVAEVAASLRAAQGEWERIGFDARARWLGVMRDWLLDNDERVRTVLQEETGKTVTDTVLETGWVCDIINNYSKHGKKMLADQSVRPTLPLLRTRRFEVVRRPHPLVGVIGPWNFPIVLCFGDGIPALLAGAAVMLKPSEVTPLALREVARGWKEIGAPPVLEAVFGGGDTGGSVVDVADFVHFTGSVKTGKLVAKRAAETLTPTSLELGGKDPIVVLADADLERAANAAVWGAFGNAGQVCVSLERAYVEAPVYDEFVQKVVEKVKALRQDVDGPKVSADVGAMISPAQIKIVADHVQDARDKGAQILTGGRRLDRAGAWYEPTVIAGADHTMRCMREETFGPTLPIMKVADAREALRMANDSEFGLSSSLFTRDVEKGRTLARQVEAGTVNVNDALIATMCIDVPMGGWKQSGIGSRAGSYGIQKYTRAQTISSPRLPSMSTEPSWMPYSHPRIALIRRLYRFFNARGVRARLGL
jgi:betaine-aldehyde dehydrogenase